MFDYKEIEKKWSQKWLLDSVFNFEDNKKPKYYVLDMFPYPSGEGLHVGHPKGYTATDVIARWKKMNGFNVLHPIGWDAFGLPAEQYAIKTGNDPKPFTQKNIDSFRKQLQQLGFFFHYEKEVNTSDEKYYKWTQWIFAKLFEHGLAEIKNIEVNWCPELGTVLANEEIIVENNKLVSERGSFPVIKKPMKQWVLKITKYADKLLEGLDELDWPEGIKAAQKKWIGKNNGFKFTYHGLDVFVKNQEQLTKVAFLKVGVKHPLAASSYSKETKEFIEKVNQLTDLERKSEFNKNIFIQLTTINEIPVVISSAVLNDNSLTYIGTLENENDQVIIEKLFLKNKEFNLSTSKLQPHTTYALKDWVFSRQRYWGEPFPIYFENEVPQLVDLKELPVTLPVLKDFKPNKDGLAPLANATKWLEYKNGTRETNTMPQWAGSCWYYLAYLLKQPDHFIDFDSDKAKNLFDRWLPVDLYIGGQEHAVLHLLYARFWHKFLFDLKLLSTKEPFFKLVNQGMILGPNGEKMSKSKGNVINPETIIANYGADSLRLYEMFMGPLEATLPWTNDGVIAMKKWLERVDRLFEKELTNEPNDDLALAFNKFITKVNNLLEALKFNLVISEMMVFINTCYQSTTLPKEILKSFLKVLSLFAPFIAEELYSKLDKQYILKTEWPKEFITKATESSEISMVVQVNGKFKLTLKVDQKITQEQVIKLLQNENKITNFLKQKHSIIFVPGKIINIVLA